MSFILQCSIQPAGGSLPFAFGPQWWWKKERATWVAAAPFWMFSPLETQAPSRSPEEKHHRLLFIVFIFSFFLPLSVTLEQKTLHIPHRQTHGGNVGPPDLEGISLPPCRLQTGCTPSVEGSSRTENPEHSAKVFWSNNKNLHISSKDCNDGIALSTELTSYLFDELYDRSLASSCPPVVVQAKTTHAHLQQHRCSIQCCSAGSRK